MAYATQDDLVPMRITLGDLTELTADDDSEGPDESVVNAALATASATVDSYCAQRYQTPLQASNVITNLTADLALYDLASRRRDTKPTETWTQRYQQAMALLKDISAGRASLDQPAAAQPQGSSADVTVPRRRQTFDDCHLKGFC
jgi:phage gp36-like protein